MSEYQYYEFRAIDRTLSAPDLRWLRSLSTRAQINAISFTNEYHWGDFKGDPCELMKRCFDAHVYTSNFGVRRLMLKVPADAREIRAMEAYRSECGVDFSSHADGILLDFSLDGEPGDWDDESGDGAGWMEMLAPLRAELLEGDLRCLYLAWLLDVQFNVLDDDECEPPVPPGLATLSAACEALVDFLHVDRMLLAAATERSVPLPAAGMSEIEPSELLASLTAKEKEDMLVQLLVRDDAATRRKLLKRLRDRSTSARDDSDAGDTGQIARCRTVGELVAAWRTHASLAQKRASEAAARAEEERASARRKHLNQVAERESAIWSEVESLVASRTPKGYEQAVARLTELRDAAALVKQTDRFFARLRDLRRAHSSKPSLVKRLDAACLHDEQNPKRERERAGH